MGQVFRRRRDIGPILYHRSPNPQAEHRGPQGGDFRLSECQEANSVLEAHDWNLPQRRHGDRLAVCWTRCLYFTRVSEPPDVVSVLQTGQRRPREVGSRAPVAQIAPRALGPEAQTFMAKPRCFITRAYETSRLEVLAGGIVASVPHARSFSTPKTAAQPEMRSLITSQASSCVWSRPCGPLESKAESCGARNSFGAASKLSHLQSVSAWS